MSYFDILAARAGAGGDAPTPQPQPVLIEKSVTENGTYTAADDEADGYSEVTVNVPNTYTQADEGKVVSNGALVAQGSDTVTANNTYDTTLINSLTVNVPSSGGGGAPESDVNFRDYDGTIVASYSAADFAALTAMPDNPTHDGLTAQGWNWTLSYAKTYVAANGKLEIGQMYTTTDGKTHIHIVLEDGRLEPVLGLGVNGSVDIDWGDGSEHTTLTGMSVNTYVSTSPHTYPAAGDYTIKLSVTGSMTFVAKNSVCGLLMKSGYDAAQSRCYINAIKSINVGNGVTGIGSYAFNACYSLNSITIPSSVTSIWSYAFRECSSLSSITIPSSVTSIWSYAFNACYSLNSITIPSSVTSIEESAFSDCRYLSSITIPPSVTSILTNVFNSCFSLSSVTISSSVTSIASGAFRYCYSLSSITIPSSVTSIETIAFQSCFGLGKITFASETPPTVSGSYAFNGIPTDCKIYVPQGSLSAYTSAQNYPSSSTYTYVEY